MEYTVEFFQKSADYVMSIIKDKPEIAIILGSGLGVFIPTKATTLSSLLYRFAFSSFSALRRPYSPMPPVLSIKATMSVI